MLLACLFVCFTLLALQSLYSCCVLDLCSSIDVVLCSFVAVDWSVCSFVQFVPFASFVRSFVVAVVVWLLITSFARCSVCVCK